MNSNFTSVTRVCLLWYNCVCSWHRISGVEGSDASSVIHGSPGFNCCSEESSLESGSPRARLVSTGHRAVTESRPVLTVSRPSSAFVFLLAEESNKMNVQDGSLGL